MLEEGQAQCPQAVALTPLLTDWQTHSGAPLLATRPRLPRVLQFLLPSLLTLSLTHNESDYTCVTFRSVTLKSLYADKLAAMPCFACTTHLVFASLRPVLRQASNTARDASGSPGLTGGHETVLSAVWLVEPHHQGTKALLGKTGLCPCTGCRVKMEPK